MNKVWIVYRPVLDYEESMENYLAATTEAEARAAARRMNEFAQSMRARVMTMPDPFEDGIPDRVWEERYEARSALLKRARWPFGISLERDIDHQGSVVAVMELKVLKTSRQTGDASA